MLANVAATSSPVTHQRTYPRWPILILAASAFVAIWGGWVSLGRLCGFGVVNLLPGIADVQVDLSITLPLGMEAYAAWATGAWLTDRPMDASARRFAKWSALAALVVGGMGQVAYHLLAAAGVEHAPWPIVIIVACIPVAVLGMASQLAYRIGAHHDPIDRSGDTDADSTMSVAGHPAEEPPAEPAIHEPPPASPPATPAGLLSDDERARIRALWVDGMSERAIARETGRSRGTVHRVLAEQADHAKRPDTRLVAVP